MNDKINLWAKLQKESKLCCPRCGKNRMTEPVFKNALSRIADIYICNECGMEEALYSAGLTRKLALLDDWYANSTRAENIFAGNDFVEFVMEKRFLLSIKDVKDLIDIIFTLTQNDEEYPFRLLSNLGFCNSEHLYMGGTLLFVLKDDKDKFNISEYFVEDTSNMRTYGFRFESFCKTINRMLSEGMFDKCIEDNNLLLDHLTYEIADIAIQYTLFDGLYRGE